MGNFIKVAIFPLIIATFLTGCGGGGSTQPVNNTPPPPAPPPPTLSNNAELTDLRISAAGLDQIFQSNVDTYTATTGFLITSTTVTASTTNPNATITINNVAADSGVSSGALQLSQGSNLVSVGVTAEDGVTTRSYTTEISRDVAAAFAQQAYIKASNTESGDFFGISVALDGNTLVVGASYEDSGAAGLNGDQLDNSLSNSGAVYIFARDPAGTWSQEAYLKASNVGDRDFFGNALDIDGDTLVVSANQEASAAVGVNGDKSDNSAFLSGAVYVYAREITGNWTEQAYIKSSNSEAGDYFGQSLAIDGDTLVVSSWQEASSATGVGGDQSDNSAPIAGAVYVFARDNVGSWSQQAYIKATNTEAGDWFGHSVALSGDTLAVGSPEEDSTAAGINGDQTDNSLTDSGAAYVFTRDSSGIWSQQAYIKASNPDGGDHFGRVVAVDDDTLVVGSPFEDSAAAGINGDQTDNSLDNVGAVYVFTRDLSENWNQQAYIKASNPDSGDGFSNTNELLQIEGNTLVVGAQLEDSLATGINMNQPDTGSGIQAGAVYIFSRDQAGSWSQAAYVKASNTGSPDFFGRTFSFDGESLAVTALWEASASTGIDGDQSDNSASQAGAVYFFE
jgi:hypothetical protein